MSKSFSISEFDKLLTYKNQSNQIQIISKIWLPINSVYAYVEFLGEFCYFEDLCDLGEDGKEREMK